MKCPGNIFVFIFLLFFSVNGFAQGDVVVHTDPRLSLLLKKNHPVIASSVKLPSHKVSAITTSAVTAPATPASPEVLSGPHAAEMALHNAPAKIIATPAVIKPAPSINWAPKHHVRTIYTGKGFRVQIYNGTDRSKAMDVKNEFSRNNPGVRTYLSYISPCFRVKVGDYRRRAEAEGMWREANSTYNPSMIVPDIITVTTLE